MVTGNAPQSHNVAYVRVEPTWRRPPPAARPSTMSSRVHAALSALRIYLIAHPISFLVTLGIAGGILLLLPDLLRFLVFDAIWHAPDGTLCRATGAGACWAFVADKLPYFIYGSYPLDQRWRVDIVFAIGACLIFWQLAPSAPGRRQAVRLFFLAYPIIALILLAGLPTFGLTRVPSDLWGGILVTLIVALTGIVISLPLGVLLALARRSQMPLLRITSIVYIEVLRGVPMITVLFMANTMLPLFLPESAVPNRLLRALVGVALFASAYMAEVVRGGLQVLPKGQGEAAQALGLRYWAMQRLVILPQALRLVIPGIVNTFIGLFKDTTLVATVGLFDFLRTVDSARLDPAWGGPTITPTAYVFAAIFYFICCFAMARYSLLLERRLSAGQGI
jgi:general L-amino acid transport system permease protein